MSKYASKYVGAGAAPSGWTKIGNIAVDATGTGSATSSFTPGILDSYDNTGYVIVSETTTAGLVGRSTGGGTGTASANTPTYWTTVAKTDNSFITLVSNIAKQTFASAASAKSWLDSNGYWTSWTAAAVSYLLDTYSGAAAAYSLRKLSSTYSGNAIRVRRSSDNAEQNIGFDGSGNLDEVALTSFVGAGNGFITTWFDQSGNGRNQTQATANNQPQIVSSGTIIKESAKPSIQFDVNKYLYSNFGVTFTQPTYYSIVSTLPTEIYGFIFDSNPNYRQTFLRFSTFNDIYMYAGVDLTNPTGNVIPGSRYLFSLLYNSTTSTGYVNNSPSVSGNAGSSGMFDLYLGARFDLSVYSGMKTQEFILWNSDQTSNRTGINTNTNTFYSIY